MTPEVPTQPDPWARLRRHTPARIALGRAGGSLPTAELLSFALAHAAARDAVHQELDVDELARELQIIGLPVLRLHSRAPDRRTYLRRPDLGRRLDDSSAALLRERAATPAPASDVSSRDASAPDASPPDVAIVVADGLSALAVHRQAPRVLERLVPSLKAAGLSLTPACVVQQGRVAVEDEIGQVLKARIAVILIGERPGLRSPDSLGAYIVFDPHIGKTDAHRNCISSIRPGGLAPAAAAETIRWLVTESLRRQISGVTLKDERSPPPLGAAPRWQELAR